MNENIEKIENKRDDLRTQVRNLNGRTQLTNDELALVGRFDELVRLPYLMRLLDTAQFEWKSIFPHQ